MKREFFFLCLRWMKIQRIYCLRGKMCLKTHWMLRYTKKNGLVCLLINELLSKTNQIVLIPLRILNWDLSKDDNNAAKEIKNKTVPLNLFIRHYSKRNFFSCIVKEKQISYKYRHSIEIQIHIVIACTPKFWIRRIAITPHISEESGRIQWCKKKSMTSLHVDNVFKYWIEWHASGSF